MGPTTIYMGIFVCRVLVILMPQLFRGSFCNWRTSLVTQGKNPLAKAGAVCSIPESGKTPQAKGQLSPRATTTGPSSRAGELQLLSPQAAEACDP